MSPSRRDLEEVSSRVYPSLERKPGKQNWVDKTGGLPSYIERIAKHLHYERGMTIGHAIASAVNKVKKWSVTGKPATKAKAIKAVAEWEAKKAKSKAKTAAKNLKESLEMSEARELLESGANLELSAEDEADLTRHVQRRLLVAEGMLTTLSDHRTRGKARLVRSAIELMEAELAKPVKLARIGGEAASSEDMKATAKLLRQEVTELRELAEALAVLEEPEEEVKAPSDEAAETVKAKEQGLKRGDAGEEVAEMQRQVMSMGSHVGDAEDDGKFGPATTRGVKAIQRREGLKADGVVGPKTKEMLDANAEVEVPSWQDTKRLDREPIKTPKPPVEMEEATLDNKVRGAALSGLRSLSNRDYSQIKRLADGTFAPLGRGRVLRPGAPVTLGSKRGIVSPDGKKIRLAGGELLDLTKKAQAPSAPNRPDMPMMSKSTRRLAPELDADLNPDFAAGVKPSDYEAANGMASPDVEGIKTALDAGATPEQVQAMLGAKGDNVPNAAEVKRALDAGWDAPTIEKVLAARGPEKKALDAGWSKKKVDAVLRAMASPGMASPNTESVRVLALKQGQRFTIPDQGIKGIITKASDPESGFGGRAKVQKGDQELEVKIGPMSGTGVIGGDTMVVPGDLGSMDSPDLEVGKHQTPSGHYIVHEKGPGDKWKVTAVPADGTGDGASQHYVSGADLKGWDKNGVPSSKAGREGMASPEFSDIPEGIKSFAKSWRNGDTSVTKIERFDDFGGMGEPALQVTLSDGSRHHFEVDGMYFDTPMDGDDFGKPDSEQVFGDMASPDLLALEPGDKVTYKGGSKHFGAMRDGEVVGTGTRKIKDGDVTVDMPTVKVKDTDGSVTEVLRSEVKMAEIPGVPRPDMNFMNSPDSQAAIDKALNPNEPYSASGHMDAVAAVQNLPDGITKTQLMDELSKAGEAKRTKASGISTGGLNSPKYGGQGMASPEREETVNLVQSLEQELDLLKAELEDEYPSNGYDDEVTDIFEERGAPSEETIAKVRASIEAWPDSHKSKADALDELSHFEDAGMWGKQGQTTLKDGRNVKTWGPTTEEWYEFLPDLADYSTGNGPSQDMASPGMASPGIEKVAGATMPDGFSKLVDQYYGKHGGISKVERVTDGTGYQTNRVTFKDGEQMAFGDDGGLNWEANADVANWEIVPDEENPMTYLADPLSAPDGFMPVSSPEETDAMSTWTFPNAMAGVIAKEAGIEPEDWSSYAIEDWMDSSDHTAGDLKKTLRDAAQSWKLSERGGRFYDALKGGLSGQAPDLVNDWDKVEVEGFEITKKPGGDYLIKSLAGGEGKEFGLDDAMDWLDSQPLTDGQGLDDSSMASPGIELVRAGDSEAGDEIMPSSGKWQAINLKVTGRDGDGNVLATTPDGEEARLSASDDVAFISAGGMASPDTPEFISSMEKQAPKIWKTGTPEQAAYVNKAIVDLMNLEPGGTWKQNGMTVRRTDKGDWAISGRGYSGPKRRKSTMDTWVARSAVAGAFKNKYGEPLGLAEFEIRPRAAGDQRPISVRRGAFDSGMTSPSLEADMASPAIPEMYEAGSPVRSPAGRIRNVKSMFNSKLLFTLEQQSYFYENSSGVDAEGLQAIKDEVSNRLSGKGKYPLKPADLAAIEMASPDLSGSPELGSDGVLTQLLDGDTSIGEGIDLLDGGENSPLNIQYGKERYSLGCRGDLDKAAAYADMAERLQTGRSEGSYTSEGGVLSLSLGGKEGQIKISKLPDWSADLTDSQKAGNVPAVRTVDEFGNRYLSPATAADLANPNADIRYPAMASPASSRDEQTVGELELSFDLQAYLAGGKDWDDLSDADAMELDDLIRHADKMKAGDTPAAQDWAAFRDKADERRPAGLFPDPGFPSIRGDMASPEFDDEAYTINDPATGKMVVTGPDGKSLGSFIEQDDALKAIRDDMEAEQYWPSVQRVGERGDIDVLNPQTGDIVEPTNGMLSPSMSLSNEREAALRTGNSVTLPNGTTVDPNGAISGDWTGGTLFAPDLSANERAKVSLRLGEFIDSMSDPAMREEELASLTAGNWGSAAEAAGVPLSGDMASPGIDPNPVALPATYKDNVGELEFQHLPLGTTFSTVGGYTYVLHKNAGDDGKWYIAKPVDADGNIILNDPHPDVNNKSSHGPTRRILFWRQPPRAIGPMHPDYVTETPAVDVPDAPVAYDPGLVAYEAGSPVRAASGNKRNVKAMGNAKFVPLYKAMQSLGDIDPDGLNWVNDEYNRRTQLDSSDPKYVSPATLGAVDPVEVAPQPKVATPAQATPEDSLVKAIEDSINATPSVSDPADYPPAEVDGPKSKPYKTPNENKAFASKSLEDQAQELLKPKPAPSWASSVSDELGGDWSSEQVTRAVSDLEQKGVTLDPDEEPAIIAAVIKATGTKPETSMASPSIGDDMGGESADMNSPSAVPEPEPYKPDPNVGSTVRRKDDPTDEWTVTQRSEADPIARTYTLQNGVGDTREVGITELQDDFEVPAGGQQGGPGVGMEPDMNSPAVTPATVLEDITLKNGYEIPAGSTVRPSSVANDSGPRSLLPDTMVVNPDGGRQMGSNLSFRRDKDGTWRAHGIEGYGGGGYASGSREERIVPKLSDLHDQLEVVSKRTAKYKAEQGFGPDMNSPMVPAGGGKVSDVLTPDEQDKLAGEADDMGLVMADEIAADKVPAASRLENLMRAVVDPEAKSAAAKLRDFSIGGQMASPEMPDHDRVIPATDLTTEPDGTAIVEPATGRVWVKQGDQFTSQGESFTMPSDLGDDNTGAQILVQDAPELMSRNALLTALGLEDSDLSDSELAERLREKRES